MSKNACACAQRFTKTRSKSRADSLDQGDSGCCDRQLHRRAQCTEAAGKRSAPGFCARLEIQQPSSRCAPPFSGAWRGIALRLLRSFALPACGCAPASRSNQGRAGSRLARKRLRRPPARRLAALCPLVGAGRLRPLQGLRSPTGAPCRRTSAPGQPLLSFLSCREATCKDKAIRLVGAKRRTIPSSGGLPRASCGGETPRGVRRRGAILLCPFWGAAGRYIKIKKDPCCRPQKHWGKKLNFLLGH